MCPRPSRFERLVFRIVLSFAVLFALYQVISDAQACNCVAWSIEALHRMHIRLKTIPSIGVNDWCLHPGCYRQSVVNVKDIDNCRVLLHEFVHHWQWEHYGDAIDLHENWRREMQAAKVTMHAEAEMEICK